MNKGKIVQVMESVVDGVFEDGNLPEIKDALEVENNTVKDIVMGFPIIWETIWYAALC